MNSHARHASLDWSWSRLRQGLASEHRYRILKPRWVEALTRDRSPFLPEASDPSFLSRPSTGTHEAESVDPLRVYWRELRRYPGLSRDDEFILARAIDLLRAVLVRQLGSAPPRAARALAEEHLSSYSPVLALLPKAQPGERADIWSPSRLQDLRQRLLELNQAQHVLIVHALGAVPAAARRYSHYGVALEDLLQEGNSALLRAVERYDRLEGVRFSHYAQCWIHQGILKALSCQARIVRLPVYLAQVLHRVRDAQAGSPELLCAEELAGRSGASRERVERALTADRACLSLDRPFQTTSAAETQTLAEQVAATTETPDLDLQGSGALRGTLQRLLLELPARESRILRLRFGLDGAAPRTLEQVRAELGVSRERVRQLQSQALRRLHSPSARRALARFV